MIGMVAGLLAVISLSIYPTVGFEPLTVRTTVHIVRDARNREACLRLDGPDYFRHTCWELHGEDAPATFQSYWTDLPAGTYVGQATLRQVSGKVYVSTALTLEVR